MTTTPNLLDEMIAAEAAREAQLVADGKCSACYRQPAASGLGSRCHECAENYRCYEAREIALTSTNADELAELADWEGNPIVLWQLALNPHTSRETQKRLADNGVSDALCGLIQRDDLDGEMLEYIWRTNPSEAGRVADHPQTSSATLHLMLTEGDEDARGAVCGNRLIPLSIVEDLAANDPSELVRRYATNALRWRNV